MKFLCASCERMSAASSFRVAGVALFLTCARCGRENPLEIAGSPTPPADPVPSPPPVTPSSPRVVPLRSVQDPVRLAREAAASDDPFAVPEGRCPKCIGDRPDEALSCPHCGLVYVNHRPEEIAPSTELAQAFREALADWDNPSRHDAVLELAARTGELPALGRLYRIRLAAAPHDPIAQHGRDEVLRRAAAASEVLRLKAPEARAPNWQYALVGVLLAGAVILTVAVLRQLF